MPGFGPNGPPNWSTAETDAALLFTDQIGEISYSFHIGLKRWLIVYGGCATDGCGIVLRSAPMPWGPWSGAQLLFNTQREGAQGKYMFECGPLWILCDLALQPVGPNFAAGDDLLHDVKRQLSAGRQH